MPRGLTSAVKTELATGSIEPVLLIDIEFSTPVYLTNASFDLSSNISGSSRTYLSNGHFRGITGVQETNAPTKNSLSLSLSAVDQAYVALALTENIINSNVYIYRGYLNSSLSLIADPFLFFYGTIDQFKVSDNTNTATLVLTLSSHWGNFSKTSGRSTTNNSQERFFPSDLGMNYSALTVRDIKWGRP